MTFPYPIAIFLTIQPLTVIKVIVPPLIQAATTYFAFVVLTEVCTSVWKNLETPSLPFIIFPKTLVYSRILVYTNAHSFSQIWKLADLSHVITVLIILDAKQRYFA